MSKGIRTFIAIKLSEDVIEQIAKLQHELKSATKEKIKWVNPKNMHVTLKFIGEIAKDRLEQVFEATEYGCRGIIPFDLSMDGLGVFPNFRRPRVIWIGIAQGKDSLSKLAENIDENLSKFGFPKEDRKFKAHLTLARLKFKPKNLIEVISEKQFTSSSILVDEVHIIKSDLKPTGPIYTTLKTIKL